MPGHFEGGLLSLHALRILTILLVSCCLQCSVDSMKISTFKGSTTSKGEKYEYDGFSRVMVAGATGYIGRQVVKECVRRGIPTASLVRDKGAMTSVTAKALEGSDIIECNILNMEEVRGAYQMFRPSSTVCCLASRSGVKKEAYEVDYGGGKNALVAQQEVSASFQRISTNNNSNLGLNSIEKWLQDAFKPQGGSSIMNKKKVNTFNSRNKGGHYVLLSAYCVGKPLLQFQFAKLQLEKEIREMTEATDCTHSIVRPTAYFKSLDGQIENARKGSPILFFGDGTCAANAICESDLAKYLADCAVNPTSIDMMNESRDIGGPDVPPITKREQIELIYDTLNTPKDKRKVQSLPLSVFDGLAAIFLFFENVFGFIDVVTGGSARGTESVNNVRNSYSDDNDVIGNASSKKQGFIPYYSFPLIESADIKGQLEQQPSNAVLSTVDAALDAAFWSSYRLSAIARSSTSSVEGLSTFGNLRQKCEDAAEIVRIVRYYASEPMVATGPGQVQGTKKLADHFKKIAARGGQLEEVDKMTTTTGALELLVSGKVLGGENGTITDQITISDMDIDSRALASSSSENQVLNATKMVDV